MLKGRTNLYGRIETGLFGTTLLCLLLCRFVFPARSFEIERIAGILLFFFWPGWFALRRLRWQPEVGVLAFVPLAFAASLALWYVVALPIFVWQGPTSLALCAALIVLYLPALLLFLYPPPEKPKPQKLTRSDMLCFVPAIGVVLFLLGMAWTLRMDIRPSYDSGYFLTIARKFAELNQIDILSAHVRGGMVDRAYGLNAYLLAVGFLARFLGQDVFLVWGTLSIYGLLFFITSISLLAARLFQSVKIGLGVMLFIAAYHVMDFFAMPPCVYANPSMLTRPLAMVLLWVFTELHLRPSGWNRAAFGLIGAAILPVHPFGLLIAFFYVLGALILSILVERGEERKAIVRETMAGGIVLIVLAAPYLFLKWLHYFPSEGPLFTLNWDLLYSNVKRFLILITVDNNMGEQTVVGYISKPSLMLYGHPWIGWLGIPMLAILFFRWTGLKRLYASILFGGVLGIVAVSFNPWLFPLAAKVLSVDQVGRLGMKMPIHGVAVLGTIGFVLAALARLVKRQGLKYCILTIFLAAYVVLIATLCHDRYQDFKIAAEKSAQTDGLFRELKARSVGNDPLIRALREELTSGEVVFNTVRDAEIVLCPQASIKVYDLFKVNWASSDLNWQDHLDREKKIQEFLSANIFRRWQIVHNLGLQYVITKKRAPLDAPFFTLLTHSDLEPALSLYRANSRGILETILKKEAENADDAFRQWQFRKMLALCKGSFEERDPLATVALDSLRTSIKQHLDSDPAWSPTLDELVLIDALDLSANHDALIAKSLDSKAITLSSSLSPTVSFQPQLALWPEPDAGPLDNLPVLFDSINISQRKWVQTGFAWINRIEPVSLHVKFNKPRVISQVIFISLQGKESTYAPMRVSILSRVSEDLPWVHIQEREWPEGEDKIVIDDLFFPATEVKFLFMTGATKMILTDIEFEFITPPFAKNPAKQNTSQ